MSLSKESSVQPSAHSLSFSHRLLHFFSRVSNHDVANNSDLIISTISNTSVFDANEQISNNAYKSIIYRGFDAQLAPTQVTQHIVKTANAGNTLIAQFLEKIIALFFIPSSSTVSTSQLSSLQLNGLKLLETFIEQCDHALLLASAACLQQLLFALVKHTSTGPASSESVESTSSNTILNVTAVSPASAAVRLKAIKSLALLFTHSTQPGWNDVQRSLHPIRSFLDIITKLSFQTIGFSSSPPPEEEGSAAPNGALQLKHASIITSISPAKLAMLEYLLQVLVLLLSHNGTRPLCKTHIAQFLSLALVLCDLNLHQSSSATMLHAGSTNPHPSSSSLLILVCHLWALTCYAGRMTDIKQTITQQSSTALVVIPFHPAAVHVGVSITGARGSTSQATTASNAKADEIAKKKAAMLSQVNAENKTLGKVETVDDFLEKNTDEDAPLLVDTTKEANKAITGGQDGLSLANGGIQHKAKHGKGHVGSMHLLAAKVLRDDERAKEFLTDEFERVRDHLHQQRHQLIQTDLKRCVVTMLLTTILEHLLVVVPEASQQYSLLLHIAQTHFAEEYALAMSSAAATTAPNLSAFSSQSTPKFELADPTAQQLLSPTLPGAVDLLQQHHVLSTRLPCLFRLLESLLTISPSSLQMSATSTGSIPSTSYSNVLWSGFGGPAGTFMNINRSLSSAATASSNAVISSNNNNNNNNNSTSLQSATQLRESEFVSLVSTPTIPTSLTMSTTERSDQYQAQQQHAQQFQLELPFHRTLQLILAVLELEFPQAPPVSFAENGAQANTSAVTASSGSLLLYSVDILPTLQSTCVQVLSTLILSSSKHILPYLQAIETTLTSLLRASIAYNQRHFASRNTLLLSLQRNIFRFFHGVLQQFSIVSIPHCLLEQLLTMSLFDLMSYFHDLSTMQQKYLFSAQSKQKTVSNSSSSSSSNKRQKVSTNATDSAASSSTTDKPNAHLVAPVLQQISNSCSLSATAQSLGFDRNTISSQHAGTGLNSTPQTLGHIEQIVQLLRPTMLDYLSDSQQLAKENTLIASCQFLASIFSSSTSSLVVSNDMFVASSRCVVIALHSSLSSSGATLLPISTPLLQSLLAAMVSLASFTPQVGILSPLFGQAVIYLQWAQCAPNRLISTFAQSSLTALSHLVTSPIAPVHLPADAVLSLEHLRDSAITQSFARRSAQQQSQLSLTSDSMVDPLDALQPNNSFPLLLFAFQQQLSLPQIQPTTTTDDTNQPDSSSPVQNVDDLMLQTYISAARTVYINIQQSAAPSDDAPFTGASSSSSSLHTSSRTNESLFALHRDAQTAPLVDSTALYKRANTTSHLEDDDNMSQHSSSDDGDDDDQNTTTSSRFDTIQAARANDSSDEDVALDIDLGSGDNVNGEDDDDDEEGISLEPSTRSKLATNHDDSSDDDAPGLWEM